MPTLVIFTNAAAANGHETTLNPALEPGSHHDRQNGHASTALVESPSVCCGHLSNSRVRVRWQCTVHLASLEPRLIDDRSHLMWRRMLDQPAAGLHVASLEPGLVNDVGQHVQGILTIPGHGRPWSADPVARCPLVR
jgi:hypothetical protein